MARKQTKATRPSGEYPASSPATASADPAEPQAEPMLITVQEACRRIGVGRTVLYPYLMTGRLRSIVMGKSERRVFAKDLPDFVESLWQEQRWNLAG